MGLFDSAVDFIGGSSSGTTIGSSGSIDWLADTFLDSSSGASTSGSGSSWLTDAIGSVSKGLGTAWDWGTKNPAVLSGVIGVGKGVMDYYTRPEEGQSASEFYKERNLRHDQSMRDYVESFNPKE